MLFALYFFADGGGGACFVVRDLGRSGCRQNYYLPPPPSPLPLFRPFFVPAHNSLLNTSDSYLKSVRAYDITTWVNDLIDPHIQCSTFFPSFPPMLAAKMGPLSSKTYSLTTLEEIKRRIVGKWHSLSVTDKLFTFFHLIREEEQVNVPPCGNCFSELVLAV